MACIHELFEAQARRTPEATAVVCGTRSLGYRDLDELANGLALELAGLGVGPDTLVGLCVERSVELVVAVLGILKAGGAYVPLDPDYPAERLRFMLADAGLPLVVVGPGGSLPGTEARVVEIGGCAAPAGPPTEVAPSNLAYVIYTSGSTGRPKGVEIEHRNVTRLFSVTREEFEFGPDDVWTLFHSFSFDFSVWEIWGALLYGGRLIIIPKEVARHPGAFYALLCEEGVTVLNQTPSAFRELIDADDLSEDGPPTLRLVIFGGEALDTSMLRPWFDRHPALPRLVNMYGITETTVHVTVRTVSPSDLKATARSPIGRPLADLSVFVLDSSRQPVPSGVRGELYIGGAGLARGYLGRPELTAERFIPNPFSDDPEDRLYRTGDVGRLLPDGEIDFLGRADDQVQIRGFRIEPGEIDAALADHPAVERALTIVRDDVDLGSRLVSYVLAEVEAEDLRQFAAARLPQHMIPSAFVRMAAFPLTANGKVDKAALPAPGRPAISGKHLLPKTPTEKRIARIWEECLGIEGVAPADDFFELGGHSLLAARMAAKASAAFEVDFPLGSVFEHPTLREFAALADRLDDPALLLFVDFDGLRKGASASDLPFAPATVRVGWIPLPEASDLLPAGTVRDYSQWLLERVEELPAVLVGYCVGASIAVQLAARLGRIHGCPLAVVLIDPAEVTRSSIREEADLLLSRLGAGDSMVRTGSELGEIVAELDEAFGNYLDAQAPEDHEMLEQMRAETLDRYTAWLAFVAAAAERAEDRLDSPLHVILSVDGAMEGLPNWLEVPASVTHLDVGRDGLLASVEAAERLLEIAGSSARGQHAPGEHKPLREAGLGHR